MNIDDLIKEHEALLDRQEEIRQYFMDHPEDLKHLFMGKCFIFNGSGIFYHDCEIFLYKVNNIVLNPYARYIQDFGCEKGYSIMTVEHELTEHCSDFEEKITSINEYRFSLTSNLYQLYKSIREVSEEEFFSELEKKTHFKNIREFPQFDKYTTYFDGRLDGKERWIYGE